jgi:transcriptional regulator with XRE-family HTH domain
MIQEELIMEDYSEDAATFGDRLALARESQNLTQEHLAKRLGLRVQTIQNWEFDRSEPRANKLQMLAGFLNVSMVWRNCPRYWARFATFAWPM